MSITGKRLDGKTTKRLLEEILDTSLETGTPKRVKLQDGTATDPALFFDDNAGIYQPAATHVGFTDGTNELMRIQTSGVYKRIQGPTDRLQVVNSTNDGVQLDSGIAAIHIGGSAVITAQSGSTQVDNNLLIDGSSTEALLVRKNGDTGDVFTVDTTNSAVTVNDSMVIDGSSTEALLVRKNGDTGDVFTVDNLNNLVIVDGSGGSGAETFIVRNSTTDVLVVDSTSEQITMSGALQVGEFGIDGSTMAITTGANDTFDIQNTSGTGLSAVTTTATLSTNGSARITIGNTTTQIDNNLIVDGSSTEALLVRKNGDTGDVLTVDTTNSAVTVNDSMVIDGTSTEALLIRQNGDTGDIMTVDTTNSLVTINDTLSVGDVTIDGTTPSVTLPTDTTLIFSSNYANSGGTGPIRINNTNTSTSSDDNPALTIQKGSTTSGTGQRFVQFFINDGATAAGGITGSATPGTPQFFNFSDSRFKRNIRASTTNALDLLNQIQLVQYEWNDRIPAYAGVPVNMGVVAEDVAAILPDLAGNYGTFGGETDVYCIGGGLTNQATLYIIKAIQELYALL